MTAVLIVLVLLIGALLGYLIWRSSEELPDESPVDPEKAMQAAVELHRIRRRLDVADLRHREWRDARRLKREIGEALEDEEP
jgi:hypothetical protein